jgi:DNA-binding CsgD family transcriptional regulator
MSCEVRLRPPCRCTRYTLVSDNGTLSKPSRRRVRVEHEFLRTAEWRLIDRELKLSAREHDIVELVLADLKESAMGARLGISPHTVHTHLERLYRKLGVRGRVQLVVRALGTCLAQMRSSDSALPSDPSANRVSPEQVTAEHH